LENEQVWRERAVEQTLDFVDIHCHLLPGVDDGPSGWEETLPMAEIAAADCVSTIVATPHQLGIYAANHGDEIRVLAGCLQSRLDERGIPLRVLPGADIRIEPGLIAKIHSGEVVTLADQGRHVLLELPHEVYLPLDRLLADFQAEGLTGILSHPERNAGIAARPGVVKSLVDQGCLIQITAGALSGGLGTRVRQVAESLVKQGLVHFVATDAHSPRFRPPVLSRAFRRVAEIAGRDAAVEMFCRNPGAVVSGREIIPGARKGSKSRRVAWLPWRRAG
jgi:protein-tyrosine phosphatase